MDQNESLIINKIKQTPDKPGVYLWKNSDGEVIYVGKAKSLRKRMIQYFEGRLNSYKTYDLVKNIDDFDIFITLNEREALILEKNLIEKYHPPYNILLLDDRRYPYIKVSIKDRLTFSFTKNLIKDKQRNDFLYGPFPQGYGAKEIMRMLEREFLYENGLPINNKDIKYWEEKRDEIIEILSFKKNNFLKHLKSKMEFFAQNLNFEIALEYKNVINYFQKLKDAQIVELNSEKNIDVFDCIFKDDKIFISVLFYRYGVLISKDKILLENLTSVNETLETFFEQYYQNKELPDKLLINKEIEELNLELITLKNVTYPKVGQLANLIKVAHEQNLFFIENNQIVKKDNKIAKNLECMKELKKLLNFQNVKNLIVFDNSTFNNTDPVGVAVVYSNGVKNKSLYKKFNHAKDLVGNYRHADVQYMYLSVKKYFQSNSHQESDVIIIDGGIPQLKEAQRALLELGISKFQIFSLVKNDHHLTRAIITNNYQEIKIENNDLFLFLKEIQIEVDRFAKSHFRKRQITSTLAGSLSKIKGIGPAIEKKLLDRFKTYSNIYNASEEELRQVVSGKITSLIIEERKKKLK
ncbi:GIY-YIG nuclease family protein [Mycoplasmopsis pullorum]|uniref:Excinuclease ABC subunit C n=1 Tax=Mycoplasmopsis pullorum TaxID=48003 RepID=A0A1L4FSS5_9BACT|nr:GIY-YIG nuclease family protein [Mycoplasmopsis pullorum]APJ38648.1 hypothetical protein BLA55_03230 [Mycoplasmopsis pullorum]